MTVLAHLSYKAGPDFKFVSRADARRVDLDVRSYNDEDHDTLWMVLSCRGESATDRNVRLTLEVDGPTMNALFAKYVNLVSNRATTNHPDVLDIPKRRDA